MTYPTTAIATGDLMTAAQINQLPVALAEASGAAASYTFSSIPSVWTHLALVLSAQDDAGTGTDDLTVQFNGDTSSIYYSQRLRGTGATASAAESLAAASGVIGRVAGTFGYSSSLIVFPNYAAAVKKAWIGMGGQGIGTSSGNLETQLSLGFWNSASAITSIKIACGAHSFAASTIATLYGMGAI